MCLNAGAMGRQDAESETLIPTIGGVFDVGITLLCGGHSNNPLDENIVPVPFDTTQITSAENGSNPQPGDPCHPLELEYRQDGTANALLTPNGGRAGIGVGAIGYGAAVRRLTPRECERLQGFPDDYTRIEWRGRPAEQCPDGPRYKALGNSMAVPVMRWIGQRIDAAAKFGN